MNEDGSHTERQCAGGLSRETRISLATSDGILTLDRKTQLTHIALQLLFRMEEAGVRGAERGFVGRLCQVIGDFSV